MPYRARAREVLELWRAAERQYAAGGSIADRVTLREEMDRLRDEYQALVEAALATDMPQPLAFPTAVRAD